MDMKDIKQAEDTLNVLVRTFRAAESLQDTLGTIKAGVQMLGELDAKVASAESTLATLNKAVGAARLELAEARIEKEKIDQAVAAIKGQLKGVGL